MTVILYGRNDSHGYNLQKRGAISINCIAEMLDGKEDEILFVDYNSSDQIPTFPEAIADTLTDKAARLLRIIRVRNDFHRQFAPQTHLVALEAQSRNIAIRRANPLNRWILSTNTDMIFAVRQIGRSMTACVSEFSDGFYHLPRFELPENLWESLNRREPAEVIRKVTEWGTSLHLNEVVFGGFDNVYEAPGDFQLFLREDLERIGGFNERMIHGWHVDSNIARRMKLLRGEVRSAVDHLFGYHCGHTRQATLLHRSDSTSNSLDTYVRDVVDPVVYDQLTHWGAPDVVFEERRISRGPVAATVAALTETIRTPGTELTEVKLDEGSYDATGYDPRHVLPHLVNLLGELPPSHVLTLMGTDVQLFRYLAEAMKRLGHTGPLLWVNAPSDCDFAKPVGLNEGLDHGEVLLLQFPAHDPSGSANWRTARWQAQHQLEAIIAVERERTTRRLVVLVNATHTPLQDTFLPAMTFTAIPYTARLRHGFVTVGSAIQPVASVPAERLRPYCLDDLALINVIANRADRQPGWERLALDLAPMFEQAGLDPLRPDLAELLSAGHRHVQAAVTRCVDMPIRVHGRDTAVSRLASATDWESSEWLTVAERCLGGHGTYALTARSRWSWERVSLVHSLRRNVPDNDRPWVLVVANGPDCLPAFVAHYGYRVAFASYARLLMGTPDDPSPWQQAMSVWHMINHADIVPLDGAITLGVTRFAAVMLAGADIGGGGPERFVATVTKCRELVEDNGYFVASVLVHLNAGTGGALSYEEWSTLFTEKGLATLSGIAPVGVQDVRIPLDCAVRYALEDGTSYVPGLSFGWGDNIVTIGLIEGRFDTKSEKILLAHGQLEQAAVRLPGLAIPEPVSAEVTRILANSFACHIIPGLSRDLTQFQHGPIEVDGCNWWLLPISLPSGSEFNIDWTGSGQMMLLNEQGALFAARTAATERLIVACAGASRMVVIMNSTGKQPLWIG